MFRKSFLAAVFTDNWSKMNELSLAVKYRWFCTAGNQNKHLLGYVKAADLASVAVR